MWGETMLQFALISVVADVVRRRSVGLVSAAMINAWEDVLVCLLLSVLLV